MLPLSPDPVAQCQTPEEVTRLCDNALAHAEALIQKIRSLQQADASQLTWEATFGAFDQIHQALQEAAFLPQLFTLAHPDAAMRAAASACEPKVDSLSSALLMDDGVATTLRRAATILESANLSPIRARFIEHVLRDYRRNGLDLPPEGRTRLRSLNEELTALGQAFEQHIAADTPSIHITPAQLAGLSDAYIASHLPESDGLIRITTNYPDLVPFLRDAEDRQAARELYARSQNRAVEKNLSILDRILLLRKEKATLLGYPTWAHYVLEPRMAKSPEIVRDFLTDLHQALKPKREQEALLFREMAEKAGLDLSHGVLGSDASYLEERLRKERFSLDTQEISQYFHIQAVQKGLFQIVETLYGIQFHAINVPVWHPDVAPFEVRDTATGRPIGRAYLDLFPREQKYTHAAMFGIRETCQYADGSRVLPIAALVCNFQRGLLTHAEVTTFFHEFGHLLHHLLSDAPLARFAGTNVARDFVEAPSQMFEEWAWHEESLRTFAVHHTTGEPLPDRLLHALQEARTFGEATFTERQLLLATIDQAYHTREPGFNTSDLVAELHPEFSSFTRLPDTHFQASFGHLVGYDAAYYGYQWALSLAFDLFTRFKNEGLMNTKIAQKYRTSILEPGGGLDEEQLMAQFLGRSANAEAYKRYLEI